MVVRGFMLSFVLATGCVAVGPIDEPEESTTSAGSGADDDADGAASQSDDGHTSMTGAATGVTATATTATTTTADPTTATVGDASDSDPTASDTGTTGSGDTGSAREQCGVEIPAGGGNFEIGCSCDTCELYWTDIDWATYEVIAAACECLCEATGCGNHVSGEAAASGGEEEGSASDSTASTGSESTTNG